MKKILPLFYLIVFLFSALSASAQKYKTIEDTVKLNQEYLSVSNDIAELNAKLIIAQNALQGYQSKATNANSDAANAASASSDQASKATSGSVGDAKAAKRKAKKAYKEAKDSRQANSKVNEQENKITHYQSELQKKQHRLEELDIMRAAINEKILSDSIPQLKQ